MDYLALTILIGMIILGFIFLIVEGKNIRLKKDLERDRLKNKICKELNLDIKEILTDDNEKLIQYLLKL